MAEYIEREALLALYEGDETNGLEFHVPIPVIIQNIKDIPAADVREVVLCRDCKSCNTSLAVGGWYGSCRYWNTHSVMADDWCSRFRHKDSEDNCGADMKGETDGT